MYSRLAIAFCAALVCVAAGPRAIKLGTGDPYPGTWNITLSPSDTGGKQFDEVLTFANNQLSAKVMATHGFGPAPYDEDIRGLGQSKFSCKQTSDTEGKIDWQGYTTGQDLTGTMTWTKKDGSVVHYDFTGSKSGT